MASKIKVDQIQTIDGTGTIALQNQLSGMTSASMPAGSVLQVVQGTTGSQAGTSSNSYQTIVSASITPTSTSSKILIKASCTCYLGTNAGSRSEFTIFRDSTNVATGISSTSMLAMGGRSSDGSITISYPNVTKLDSPSSTSAITYAFKARNNDASVGAFNWCWDNSVAEITLMEIAG